MVFAGLTNSFSCILHFPFSFSGLLNSGIPVSTTALTPPLSTGPVDVTGFTGVILQEEIESLLANDIKSSPGLPDVDTSTDQLKSLLPAWMSSVNVATVCMLLFRCKLPTTEYVFFFF